MHDWFTDYMLTIGSSKLSGIEFEYTQYKSVLLEHCPDIAYLCQYLLSTAGRGLKYYVKEE
jgi:hypothetical protein